MLHPDRTGLIVPQENPSALALALQKLLENSSLRVKLATEARKLMESEFDIHANAASLRQLFQSSSKLENHASELMAIPV